MRYVKKIALVLIVLFCLYYLFSQPEVAAGAVRGAVDAVFNAVAAVFTFFASLAG